MKLVERTEEWQNDCTIQSVLFVKEAQKHIIQLQKAVDAIKSKRAALYRFVSPLDFLRGSAHIAGLDEDEN